MQKDFPQKVHESKNAVSESSSLHCVVQLNSIGKIFTNYNLSQFLKSQEMLVIYFLSAILNEGLSVFISGSSFLPVLSISNTFLMLKTPNHSLLLKGPMFSVHCSESSSLKAQLFWSYSCNQIHTLEFHMRIPTLNYVHNINYWTNSWNLKILIS